MLVQHIVAGVEVVANENLDGRSDVPIGRLPARALLLYRHADKRVQQYFLLGKYPRPSHVDELVARLRALSPGAAIELGVRGGHVARLVDVMLADLEQHGAVRRDARAWRVAEGARLVTARDVLTQRYQQRAHEDRARLDALVGYCGAG
jgi:ATP-dependent DNA helicase RecQ